MQQQLTIKDILEQILLAIILFFTIFYSVWAKDNFGTDKVIYGDDDRVSLNQLHASRLSALAKSTAAMISWEDLDVIGDRVTIRGKSLKQDLHLCPGEHFANEINPVNCSGFLITPNILVTAGHCVESYADCQNYAWVFDFTQSNKQLSYQQSVFRCTAILQQVYSSDDQHFPNDYAVIMLDRSTHRKITPRRIRGKVSNNAKLAVVGHPSGLPQKIATHGTIRDNQQRDFFVTNLDTFGGNSGSPVIDLRSGLIEGILVRGEDDYTYDPTLQCATVKRCSMQGCRGEDVTRITNITFSTGSKTIFDAIKQKKIWSLFKLKRYPHLQMQQERDSGNTPLMTAISSGNLHVAKYLLSQQYSNINQTNKWQETALTLLAKIRDSRLDGLINQLVHHPQFAINTLYHNRSALMTSAVYGYTTLTQTLLRQGADPNKVNARGYNALIYALRNDHTVTAKILLPITNIQHRDIDGWSPLLVAARYTNRDLVERITHQITDINQQNIYGHTALMLSILNSHPATFNFLVNLPTVDLNIQRRNGQTAAHFALQNNKLNKFFKLIEKGARTDIKDNRKLTVIDMLRRMNRFDLIDQLQHIIKRGTNDE